MATTSEILANGSGAGDSSDFDVDSTPVSVFAVVTGGVPPNVVLGRLMRKDDNGAYQEVDFIEFQGCRRQARIYSDAKELCVVAPGTYRITRPDLSAYSGVSVLFDKAVSA